MRKSKEIEIAGRKLEVRKLRVRDILRLLDQTPGRDLEDLRLQADQLLQDSAGLKSDDLLDLYPGEVKELWNAVREVNSDFFDLAGSAGLGEIMAGLRTAFVKDLSRALAGSSKPAT